jgi:energy-coupling factor transport system permease protein
LEEFELMRYVTIGQYLPTGSRLHRLDPRAKLAGLGLLIVTAAGLRSLGALLALLALVLAIAALARIPLGFAAASLRPALPVLLFIAALQLLFGWGAQGAGCVDLWSWWILSINTCSLLSVLMMMARLACLIILTGLISMTSTVSELTHAVEALLRPYRRLGVPSHELAMTFTLALRFVPTLAEQLEKLLKAQAARGANIRMGRNPLQRVRHFLPVLIPLFLTTLRRGEELAEAMEARGYPGRRRTQYVALAFRPADAIAAGAALLLAVGLFALPFPAFDQALLGWLAQIHLPGSV